MKLPQLVSTGNETDAPLALAEISTEVSTDVKLRNAIVLRSALFVILIKLARCRLIPFRDAN